jgi:hypothetical protein
MQHSYAISIQLKKKMIPILSVITLLSTSIFSAQAQVRNTGQFDEIIPCTNFKLGPDFHLVTTPEASEFRSPDFEKEAEYSLERIKFLRTQQAYVQNLSKLTGPPDKLGFPPYSAEVFTNFDLAYPGINGVFYEKTTVSEDEYRDFVKLSSTPTVSEDTLIWEPYSSLFPAAWITPGIKFEHLNRVAQVCGFDNTSPILLRDWYKNNWVFSNKLDGLKKSYVEVQGLVNQPGLNPVKAEFKFYYTILKNFNAEGYTDSAVSSYTFTLVLESLNGDGQWHTVTTGYIDNPKLSHTNPQKLTKTMSNTIRLESNLPQNTIFRVRFEANLDQSRSGLKTSDDVMFVFLERASVFGSQCYPDLSNPGKCL